MSELRIFYKEKEKIRIGRNLDVLKELDKKDIIWIIHGILSIIHLYFTHYSYIFKYKYNL